MRFLVALMLLVSSAAYAELEIRYMEPAMFLTVTKGTKSGKVICLANNTEPKEGFPVGWKILTCNSLESPMQWVICYANVEKRSFICGKKYPA